MLMENPDESSMSSVKKRRAPVGSRKKPKHGFKLRRQKLLRDVTTRGKTKEPTHDITAIMAQNATLHANNLALARALEDKRIEMNCAESLILRLRDDLQTRDRLICTMRANGNIDESSLEKIVQERVKRRMSAVLLSIQSISSSMTAAVTEVYRTMDLCSGGELSRTDAEIAARISGEQSTETDEGRSSIGRKSSLGQSGIVARRRSMTVESSAVDVSNMMPSRTRSAVLTASRVPASQQQSTDADDDENDEEEDKDMFEEMEPCVELSGAAQRPGTRFTNHNNLSVIIEQSGLLDDTALNLSLEDPLSTKLPRRSTNIDRRTKFLFRPEEARDSWPNNNLSRRHSASDSPLGTPKTTNLDDNYLVVSPSVAGRRASSFGRRSLVGMQTFTPALAPFHAIAESPNVDADDEDDICPPWADPAHSSFSSEKKKRGRSYTGRLPNALVEKLFVNDIEMTDEDENSSEDNIVQNCDVISDKKQHAALLSDTFGNDADTIGDGTIQENDHEAEKDPIATLSRESFVDECSDILHSQDDNAVVDDTVNENNEAAETSGIAGMTKNDAGSSDNRHSNVLVISQTVKNLTDCTETNSTLKQVNGGIGEITCTEIIPAENDADVNNCEDADVNNCENVSTRETKSCCVISEISQTTGSEITAAEIPEDILTKAAKTRRATVVLEWVQDSISVPSSPVPVTREISDISVDPVDKDVSRRKTYVKKDVIPIPALTDSRETVKRSESASKKPIRRNTYLKKRHSKIISPNTKVSVEAKYDNTLDPCSDPANSRDAFVRHKELARTPIKITRTIADAFACVTDEDDNVVDESAKKKNLSRRDLPTFMSMESLRTDHDTDIIHSKSVITGVFAKPTEVKKSRIAAYVAKPGKIVYNAGRANQPSAVVPDTETLKSHSLLPRQSRSRSKPLSAVVAQLQSEDQDQNTFDFKGTPPVAVVSRTNRDRLLSNFDLSLNDSLVLPAAPSVPVARKSVMKRSKDDSFVEIKANVKSRSKTSRMRHSTSEQSFFGDAWKSTDEENDDALVNSPHGILLRLGNGKRTKPRAPSRSKTVSYASADSVAPIITFLDPSTVEDCNVRAVMVESTPTVMKNLKSNMQSERIPSSDVSISDMIVLESPDFVKEPLLVQATTVVPEINVLSDKGTKNEDITVARIALPEKQKNLKRISAAAKLGFSTKTNSHAMESDINAISDPVDGKRNKIFTKSSQTINNGNKQVDEPRDGGTKDFGIKVNSTDLGCSIQHGYTLPVSPKKVASTDVALRTESELPATLNMHDSSHKGNKQKRPGRQSTEENGCIAKTKSMVVRAESNEIDQKPAITAKLKTQEIDQPRVSSNQRYSGVSEDIFNSPSVMPVGISPVPCRTAMTIGSSGTVEKSIDTNGLIIPAALQRKRSLNTTSDNVFEGLDDALLMGSEAKQVSPPRTSVLSIDQSVITNTARKKPQPIKAAGKRNRLKLAPKVPLAVGDSIKVVSIKVATAVVDKPTIVHEQSQSSLGDRSEKGRTDLEANKDSDCFETESSVAKVRESEPSVGARVIVKEFLAPRPPWEESTETVVQPVRKQSSKKSSECDSKRNSALESAESTASIDLRLSSDGADGRRSRRAASNAVSYKEPPLGAKLRRGDPHTSSIYGAPTGSSEQADERRSSSRDSLLKGKSNRLGE